ncbi:hypothetical protein MKW94_002336 [Papaver nudicaule]|uniref:At3g05675-like ankyrin-like domain-containing protein n=1 Tax=Papaver nudicaule TaxID=74823 RepID=A0AA41SJR0_PAPNU|nr:hypothetical protein [Papaver nudicaule]
MHSCLEYLGAIQWVGEEEKVNEVEEENEKINKEEKKKINKEEGEKVDEASDISGPFIDTLARIIKVVLKTDAKRGRNEGKCTVLKLLFENNGLLKNVNSAETFNKYILSTCQSCLNSLLNLAKEAVKSGYVGSDIAREADNLLWLLDILADRKSAEEFALMWANQQELANLLMKYWHHASSRHLISCITARLLVGIGNGRISAAEETRQVLWLTWFPPLSNDYSCLKKTRLI